MSPAGHNPKLRASCDACKYAKVRCSQDRPTCQRCLNNGSICQYSPSRRMGRPRKKVAPNLHHTTTTITALETTVQPSQDTSVLAPAAVTSETPCFSDLPTALLASEPAGSEWTAWDGNVAYVPVTQTVQLSPSYYEVFGDFPELCYDQLEGIDKDRYLASSGLIEDSSGSAPGRTNCAHYLEADTSTSQSMSDDPQSTMTPSACLDGSEAIPVGGRYQDENSLSLAVRKVKEGRKSLLRFVQGSSDGDPSLSRILSSCEEIAGHCSSMVRPNAARTGLSSAFLECYTIRLLTQFLSRALISCGNAVNQPERQGDQASPTLASGDSVTTETTKRPSETCSRAQKLRLGDYEVPGNCQNELYNALIRRRLRRLQVRLDEMIRLDQAESLRDQVLRTALVEHRAELDATLECA